MSDGKTNKSGVATPHKDDTGVVNASLLYRCAECGDEYQPYREWDKFCSDKCKWDHWKQNHVRVNKIIMAFLFGAGWQKKYEAEKKNREQEAKKNK